MKKLLSCLLICGLLTGCATEARKQMEALSKIMEENEPREKECFENLEKQPDTQYVRKYVLLKFGSGYTDFDTKVALMSSERKLDPEMKKHFKAYLNEAEKCMTALSETFRKLDTRLYRIYEKFRVERRELLISAFSGAVSIGEMNRTFDRLAYHSSTAIENRYMEIFSALQAQDEREQNLFLARFAAGMAASAQAHAQNMERRRLEMMKTPVTTHCYQDFSGGVSCSSY